MIRRVILEQPQQYDTIQMIRDYKGGKKFLNDLKQKLISGKKLTEKQLLKAIEVLKQDFYGESEMFNVLKNHNYQKKIQQLGTTAYLNLIKTKKRALLKPLSDNYKIVVDKPSEDWVKRNLNDLQFFIDSTVDSPSVHKFEDRIVPVKTHAEAKNLMSELKKDKFFGFVEVEGDRKIWSILNKINTNYTNWAKMITKRDLEGDLGDGKVIEKFDNYFKQRPIEEFYEEVTNLDDSQKLVVKEYANTLSFAEFDIIEAYHNQTDESRESASIDPLSNILNRIKKTTDLGDKSENDFINWLMNEKKIPVSDIHNFSSWGNLVDITFQLDMILTLNGNPIPIQVKSSDKSSKLLKYDIGGIVVFPTEPKLIEKYGRWSYRRAGEYPASFEKDFIG